jgi:D-glycero-D-manno-heptose 1,7-bisphosphate phosphatase
MKQKCVFFDRDGIVNVSPGPGYVERWEDLHLIPEFVAAAKIALAHDYAVAIITNQRGVARGIMSQATLDDMHAKLCDALEAQGVPLLGIFCCTHERDSCECRKPLPGLLLQAAKQNDIDLSVSWMVGDRETDVQAGHNAGCHTVLVSPPAPATEADVRVDDMNALVVGLPGLLA